MLIIQMKDLDRWGSTKLYSTATWGAEINKREAARMADQVVDAFHRRVKQAGLLIQWQPSPAAPELNVENDLVPNMELLEQFLDEAYQEILAIGIDQVTRVEYSQTTGIVNPGVK